MCLFSKLSLVNPYPFSKLYCNHMKQKFCHLLFTLANVNCWVTYTNYSRNMHYCSKESIIYRRPLNSRECFEGHEWSKAYFGGQGRRYYVQHCATLGDIGNFQRKVVCVAGRNCATLSDIGRHWTKLNSNIQMSNIIIHKLCIYIENTTVNIKIYFSYQKLVPVAKNTISLLQIVCKNNKEHFSNC